MARHSFFSRPIQQAPATSVFRLFFVLSLVFDSSFGLQLESKDGRCPESLLSFFSPRAPNRNQNLNWQQQRKRCRFHFRLGASSGFGLAPGASVARDRNLSSFGSGGGTSLARHRDLSPLGGKPLNLQLGGLSSSGSGFLQRTSVPASGQSCATLRRGLSSLRCLPLQKKNDLLFLGMAQLFHLPASAAASPATHAAAIVKRLHFQFEARASFSSKEREKKRGRRWNWREASQEPKKPDETAATKHGAPQGWLRSCSSCLQKNCLFLFLLARFGGFKVRWFPLDFP